MDKKQKKIFWIILIILILLAFGFAFWDFFKIAFGITGNTVVVVG